MREVNFSIPSSNKASVGITTALYDRRALDCTSTLPLINSLNHLCYLTQSSARIREILTVDGGIERLVCILKNGRSKDVLGTWKWNLALQCAYNIGVRGSDVRGSDSQGSETIRIRVVEADIVPVLATVLDNYIQVMDKIKSRDDESVERSRDKCASRRHRHAHNERASAREHRSSSRREAPPPISIPQNLQTGHVTAAEGPLPRLHNQHQHHHHHRRHASMPGHLHSAQADGDSSTASTLPRENQISLQPPEVVAPPMTSTSQPETPLSPQAPVGDETPLARQASPPAANTPRRPSIRHEHSTSADSDDGQLESSSSAVEIESDVANPAQLNIQPDDGIAASDGAGNEAGTFAINQRSADVSLFESTGTTTAIDTNLTARNMPPAPAIHFSPVAGAPAPERPRSNLDGPMRDHLAASNVLASVPRDEDVIMSLQLLAYVSKYSDLRSFFQQSHLVPRLKIQKELERLESKNWAQAADDGDDVDEVSNDDEYCQPSDYNIFPLVEKFTLRHHASDMKYWAGVVLRNLCRKDRKNGDIRQCAYYKCGKWETQAKQFAKCRRCRQTKYCSKDCQKMAWTLHRFWCTDASEQRT